MSDATRVIVETGRHGAEEDTMRPTWVDRYGRSADQIRAEAEQHISRAKEAVEAAVTLARSGATRTVEGLFGAEQQDAAGAMSEAHEWLTSAAASYQWARALDDGSLPGAARADDEAARAARIRAGRE